MNLFTISPRAGSVGKRAATLLFVFGICIQVLFAQPDSAKPKAPRPMSWKDIPSWKYIPPQKVELSPDGKWLAWPLVTTEGDGELILKSTKDTVTRKYPVGGSGQPG